MQDLGGGAPAFSLSLPSYPEPAYSAPTAASVREHRAGMGVLVPSKIFGQIISSATAQRTVAVTVAWRPFPPCQPPSP
jgi:hypothetical protein